MKRIFVLLPLLFITATLLLAQQHKAEKITLPGSGLNNLYRMDKGVYRSEQPTAEDFEALEAYGIKEVLSLRGFHSDEDEAKGTNLTLHRLKTHAHAITEKQVTEALQLIRNRKGPILIHCRHGSDRTGAVLAMYRIIFQDYSKEQAINEMKEGGFGFHRVYGNIVRMINQADIDRIKEEVLR